MTATFTLKLRPYKYRIQEITATSLAAEAVAGTKSTTFRIIKIKIDLPFNEGITLQGFYKTYDDAFEEVSRLIKEQDEMVNTDFVKNIWEII